MLYRENGQFKTTYGADQQVLPIAQDRWFMLALIAFAYLAVPLLASDYMFRALIIPFIILAIALASFVSNTRGPAALLSSL